MIFDLVQACGAGVVGERVEAHHRAGQVVEQRGELVMEQRQPVLHALVLMPRRDRLVERVVALDGTE